MFKRKPVEVEVMIVRRKDGVGRSIMIVLFALWGVGGFLLTVLQFAAMLGPTVSVGQSAFAAAVALIWIGGLIFFGLGAAIASPPLTIAQYRSKDGPGAIE